MPTDAAHSSVNGLIDSHGLARELGVSPATIRSWRKRGAEWLPEPVGELSGAVWRVSDLEALKARMPSGVGRPPKRDVARRADTDFAKAIRRSRGIYYTPDDAAHFMAKWLVRQPGGTYLEPSLGDGIFIEAVNDAERALGGDRPHWVAVELDVQAAMEASRKGLVQSNELRIGDFLAQDPPSVEGAIANPPYVRLRHLDDEARQRALDVAERCLGQKMKPSGSIWMPFVLHMVEVIKKGGRLAIVLPLDLTYVSYGFPLWSYLARNFGSLRVLRSRKRIFQDINQDVLILLADEKGGATQTVHYEAYESLEEMVHGTGSAGGPISIDSITSGDRAFQRALLPEGVEDLLTEGLESKRLVIASELAKFHIGYVAGDKDFFHPTAETVEQYKLPRTSLHKSLINARRLRGKGLRTSGLEADQADLLWDPQEVLTPGEKQYIRKGEKLGVHQGYKAQRRSPWYKVPGVKTPDAIITVFSEQPLVLVNDDGWTASNSLLCAYVHEGVTAEEFAASWYNPLSLLSVGLEVHSLGGGVMVMVPGEASKITLLNPQYVEADLSRVDELLRAGDIPAAYEAGSHSLKNTLGKQGMELILASLEDLTRWRTK